MMKVGRLFSKAVVLTCLCLGIAVLVAGADDSTTPSAGAVDLQPHFKPGRTAVYKVWTRWQTHNTATFGENSRSSETQYAIDGHIKWTVDEVREDGSASCTMTILWMTWNLTDAQGKLHENDSRQESGDIEPVHRMLAVLAGAPIRFDMASDGSVQSVSGLDVIRSEAGEGTAIPDDLDFIESATDLATIAFAPADITQGDTFQAQYTWSHQLGKMHHQTQYTLDAVDQVEGVAIATVSARATLELEADMSKFPDNAPVPQIDLTEADFSSRIMFDLLRHEAVGRNTVENRTVTITMDIGDLSIVTTVKEKIHSQVLRIEEY